MYLPLMPQEQPSILEALTQHLSDLTREREQALSRIKEIDDALSKVAKQLGLNLNQVEASVPQLPRLPKPPASPDTSTMGGAIVQLMLAAEKGLSRSELRAEVCKIPKFNAQIENNMNSFYNTVSRYLKKGRITEVEGLLFHPDRAPLPEGEEDPTGQHLPANVTLFGPPAKRLNDA